MTFNRQSSIWLKRLEQRKHNPVKLSTLAVYRAYTQMIPDNFTTLKLNQIENGQVKNLIEQLNTWCIKPATIQAIFNVVKQVMSSAVDENGNELFPRKWNFQFLDLPQIGQQKSPSISREQLEEAVSRLNGQYKVLAILLAGTGLRIGEARALKMIDWNPAEGTIVINKSLWREKEQTPKTNSSIREVNLAKELTVLFNQYFNERIEKYLFASEIMPQPKGFLFSNTDGKPLKITSLTRMFQSAGIPGFHSLRRFRITHLRANGVPEEITKYWVGHSTKNITDKYSKLTEDKKLKREWADKIGLGFAL